ncbi:MAG: redoxin domain-containing protein [Bacteroidales bacterium]|nr:redoxin domain-containing protein [Bacteroidales bacterium]
MKKTIFLYTFIFLSFFVSSQNVYISGHGKDIAGKTISFSCVEDRFSEYVSERKSLDLENGDTTFSVGLLLDGIKEVIVQIDLMKFSFFAEPGMKYELKVDEFNFTQEDSAFAFMYGMILPASLSSEKYDAINISLNEADNLLSDYAYKSRRLLYLKDSASIAGLVHLRDSLSEKHKGNEYLQQYLRYEFEAILYSLNLRSRSAVTEKHFAQSPVLYDNVGYADCFQTVFEKYFSKGYKYISLSDMETYLVRGDYFAFNDALGRDKTLSNEILRELVFLQGMKDAYFDNYFNKTLILNILQEFINQTKFDRHKQIAQNLIKRLSSWSNTDTDITGFKVKNVEGDIVELKSFFNGKPTLIAFVKLEDVACLKELESIHFCYDSIKENCNVIAICCDNSYEKMYNFIRNNKVGNKYRWPFVHFDNNYAMTKAFRLRMFPTFILLNSRGKIEENPLRSPSDGSLMRFKSK